MNLLSIFYFMPIDIAFSHLTHEENEKSVKYLKNIFNSFEWLYFIKALLYNIK